MINTNDLIIRYATNDDVEGMTNLHLSSFSQKDHIPVMFGKNYIRAIYKWIVLNKKTIAVVAEYQNEIVGFLCAHDSFYEKEMFLECFPNLIQSFFEKPFLIFSKELWKRLFRFRNSSHIKTKVDFESKKIAQIMFGAIHEGFRGKSIYGLLNKKVIDYYKNKGFRAIRGEVYKYNNSVKRSKEKDFWVEIPFLETSETITYILFLDGLIAHEIGMEKYDKS